MLQSLHIIGSRRLGGAESFFLRLVRALNNSTHGAAAIVRPNSDLFDALKGSLAIHPVAMRNGWDLLSVAAIRKLIAQTKVDIVQTYMGRASRLTRMPNNCKTIHVARLGGYYKIDGYYRHADAWVGNTRGICDYLVEQGLPSHRVYHISNFVESPKDVDDDQIRQVWQKADLADNAIVIFALGRFIRKKGFDDLLKAFSRTPSEIDGRPVHLVLAGDGPSRDELLNLALSLDLGRRFHWTGWLHDPAAYLRIADLFVIPSLHEPLGNVILEAWSYGLPVISTTTDGALELIENEQNGLLVPIGNPDAMASAIKRCLSDHSGALSRLGDCGRMTLEANHSETTITSAYLDMYQRLCGSKA